MLQHIVRRKSVKKRLAAMIPSTHTPLRYHSTIRRRAHDTRAVLEESLDDLAPREVWRLASFLFTYQRMHLSLLFFKTLTFCMHET